MNTDEYVVLSTYYSHYTCLDVKWINSKNQNEGENDKMYVKDKRDKCYNYVFLKGVNC